MTAPAPAPKREHRATYAADKKKGGWNVRVVGPRAARFVGRSVPVTMRDGTEHMETLERLIWSGTDKDTGEPVALYTFVAKPRDEQEAVF